jgi:hypothetical protein
MERPAPLVQGGHDDNLGRSAQEPLKSIGESCADQGGLNQAEERLGDQLARPGRRPAVTIVPLGVPGYGGALRSVEVDEVPAERQGYRGLDEAEPVLVPQYQTMIAPRCWPAVVVVV